MAIRPGVLLVHKPAGATSFARVQALIDEAKALGLSRQLPVVHGGALDPFAQGLLAIHVGQATKLVDLVHAAPKRYRAAITWGAETDSGDPGGTPTRVGDPSTLTPSRLDQALATFVGWHAQVPPATSNKRVQGERAWVRAHRGEQVELQPEQVYLHAARWCDHQLPRTSTLELVCKGGFYVRALARDLGRALGIGAHLLTLERLAIGSWEDPGPGHERWLSGAELLPWLPSRALTDDEAIAAEQGQPIATGHVDPADAALPEGFPLLTPMIRALHRDRLLALLEPQDGALAPRAHFKSGL